MNKQHRSLALSLCLAAVLPLAGCATAEPEPQTPAAPRELNRQEAIQSAVQDAAQSYGQGWSEQAEAQYRGGYWVVDLHGKAGYTLHYGINAHDGTIRERNMVQ